MYNGHRSRNSWNVSLWIMNDESLYKEASDLAKVYGKGKGAFKFYLRYEGHKTPDGCPFTKTSIREAFRSLP